MSLPAIIYLAIVFAGLLIVSHEHGKPRDPHNIWITLVATSISLGLLYWGGFFN